MALALAIVLFLTVALGVFSFGAAAYAPSSVLGARLRALGWQKSQPHEKPAFREMLEHALDPFSKALPLSPSEVSRTRKWLIQAGYREPRHLTMYVGSRMLLALVGMLGVVAVEQGFDLLLMIGVGGFGFFVPRFVLKRMIKDRQRRITIALPDALDLTVICVEVGLALDQALMRVGEDLKYSHPDLSDEFYLVNLEMRAGKPRAKVIWPLSCASREHTGRGSAVLCALMPLAFLLVEGCGSSRRAAYIPSPCAFLLMCSISIATKPWFISSKVSSPGEWRRFA